MWVPIYLFLLQSILYNQYELVKAKAMVGENVRRAYVAEFPSVVSIKVVSSGNSDIENNHGCGGALITKKQVLTAAHGVTKIPKEMLEVHVGSIDLRHGDKIAIQRIITYNNWAERKGITPKHKENDIAIVLLKRETGAYALPSPLAFIQNYAIYGKTAITAGWGRPEGSGRSRYLLTAKLKILSDKDCVKRLNELVHGSTIFDTRYICSYNEPFTFLRKGDSGSPLLYNDYIIAVNKGSAPFEDDDFNPKKVNMHIGILYYRPFIEDIMENVHS